MSVNNTGQMGSWKDAPFREGGSTEMYFLQVGWINTCGI